MTNEQINISIAEACGWRKGDLRPSWCHPDNWSMAKNGSYEVWVSQDKLPDYCNDLNAMHEAESTLDTLVGRLKFPEILAQVVSRYEGFRGNGIPLPEWHRTHATARQRAEAFLRTFGKWEE